MVLLALTGVLPIVVALAGAHGISEYAPTYEVPIACWALASGLLPLVPAFFIIRDWAAGLAPQFRRTNLLLDISARAELRAEARKPSLARQLTTALNQVSSPLEAEIIDTGRKLGQYCPWATPSLPLIAVCAIVCALLIASIGTAVLGGGLEFRSMEDLSLSLWLILFAPGLISAILPYGVAAALAQEEYQRYIRAQLSPARGEAPEE